MPKKTIELTGEVDVDHSLIDGEGFLNIQKQVNGRQFLVELNIGLRADVPSPMFVRT